MHALKYILSLLLVGVASATLDTADNVADETAMDDMINNYRTDQRRFTREIPASSIDTKLLSAGSSSKVPIVDGSRWASVERQAADDVAANQTSRQLGSLLGGLFPNTPQCVYCTNCNFIGFDLYLVINILSPITCGNIICGGDSRCTHFVHDPNTNGGTCLLKQSAGSGGLWSTPVTSPSGVVCGHIPKRSCAPASLISLCLDLNLNIL